VIATTTALKLADYVVTEAGFGADLGAEKFMNIKCRKAGLAPSAVVLVATVRAMKMNGGVAKNDLNAENVAAVQAGCPNLGRHIENLKSFGVPVVVAINHFVKDTDAEVQAVQDYCAEMGTEAILSKHWADGSAGSENLARRVAEIADSDAADFSPLYSDEMSLADKVQTICKKIYRADEAVMDKKILDQLQDWESQGYGHLPVCMAKTQYSFSTDPTQRGAPTGHVVPVREVRISAGAGFIVVVCGEIMTMPGLPRKPAAETIYVNADGEIEGLF
jgi:formate--tetrahydrofolate ligase